MGEEAMLIVLDPGHGMSNRKAGVYDPGAVNAKGAAEAYWALYYAALLGSELAKLGCTVLMTRQSDKDDCPLMMRPKLARDSGADLLVSLHLNADAAPGDARKDGRVKGYEVLWRTAASKRVAEALSADLGAAKKVKFRSPQERGDLGVLSYSPSVLVELGFIDDPDDFELISNPAWAESTCRFIAQSIVEELR